MSNLLKNTVFIFFAILIFPQISIGQLNTYHFEQIDSLQKLQKRTVIVFIHTDWCRYCQAMKNTTLRNDSIINKINEKFYFIEFNAEENKNIVFSNRIFRYKPTGRETGTHELAEQLATVDNKVSYPTLCFLNSKNEIIFQYTEFVSTSKLMAMLRILN